MPLQRQSSKSRERFPEALSSLGHREDGHALETRQHVVETALAGQRLSEK